MSAFLGGRRRYATRIYAQGLTAGGGGARASVLQPGFVIKHYGRNDVLQRVFDSRTQFGKVLSLDWEETERGSSQFGIRIPRELASSFTHYDRIDIHPFCDPTPWFSGYVTRVPDGRRSGWPDDVRGLGWHRFLEKVRFTGSYTNQETADIVDTLARDVENRTRIVYNSLKLDDTAYVATNFAPLRQEANKAFDDLATLAGGYVWGVDASRHLFFRPEDTEERYWKWLGPHVHDVVLYEDSSDLVNVLHVKSGKVQGAGQDTFVGTLRDEDSITAHGEREGEETAPSFLDNSDALRWGQKRLEQLKDPKRFCSIENVQIGLGERIQAKGYLRLHLRDQTSVALPIKRTAYTMNATEVRVSIDVGEIRRSPYEAAQEYWNDLERQKLLHDQTLKQVS